MFHAIEKSKVRDQFTGLDSGSSWRKVYRQYEDFLTAAVFGRLIYLPSNLLWSLIKRSSFDSEQLPEFSGYLENYEFWPKWEVPRDTELSFNYKEPDVFLQFRKIDVIIEAKLGDKVNLQSPQQWAEEIIAKMYQSDEANSPTKPTLLFAIGGFGNNISRNQFLKKKEECYRIISKLSKNFNYEHIIIKGGTWQSLQKELKRVLDYLLEERRLQEKYGTVPLERINLYHLVKDIINILAFHGIKEWRYFSNIIEHIPNYQISSESFDLISKSNFHSKDRNWWEQEELMPIKDKSLLLMKKEDGKMNNNKLSKALVDVRKAYRLVYLYTASILDAVQRISQEFSCKFYVWTPHYYSNSPRLTTSPFPPSRWAWDMIPFYNPFFFFLYEGANPNTQKKGDWMLEISIETDSSATDKFSECEEEPNPLDFESPEKAESNFYLRFYYCTQSNEFDWYHHFWKNVDYPDKEVDVIEEYGLKYLEGTYELSKLFTEKTLLECVADFKNLIKANFPTIKNL